MATFERLIDTKELHTNLWRDAFKRHVWTRFFYNERVDSISILIVDPTSQKIVHYLDDYVALYYEPESMEVIGLRIEAFQHSFLPKYAELEQVWRMTDVCDNLEDFGDLQIVVRKQERRMTTELSRITHMIAEQQGLELPVPV
jgi:hypothetical protein